MGKIVGDEPARRGALGGLSTRAARVSLRRRAFTLMEVIVTMTIMGVLISIPAPMFSRAVEQSRFDIAVANLRSIWAAQRFFYLENGRYGRLAELVAGPDDLIDPALVSDDTFYRYAISVDGPTFTATATHPGTPRCSGTITLDHSGSLDGEVIYNGQPLALSEEFAK